jgi:hypothetical protein
MLPGKISESWKRFEIHASKILDYLQGTVKTYKCQGNSVEFSDRNEKQSIGNMAR